MVNKQKYNEIFKLKDMLEKAAIPFDLIEPPAEPKYKPFESVDKAMEAI